MKYLIINADDFGYCPKRNQAIVDLFKKKFISSTSLLVNGDYAYQACLDANIYQIPMGIHINLTEGRPITKDLLKIQSLINSQGFLHGKFGLRNELEQGNIQLEHIEYEIRMQLNKYEQLTNGNYPRHIDGHQHIHIHPLIVDIIARIAKEYKINYIRVPNDHMIDLFSIENYFYKQIFQQTKNAMKIFDQYSLNYLKNFFGITIMGKEFTIDNIEKCLQNFNKENIFIELMCHPGYPSDPFIGGCGTGQPDEFSQSNERLNEYNILSSNELKILFYKNNVKIYNYENINSFFNKDMLNDDEVNVDANHYE